MANKLAYLLQLDYRDTRDRHHAYTEDGESDVTYSIHVEPHSPCSPPAELTHFPCSTQHQHCYTKHAGTRHRRAEKKETPKR